MTIVLVPWSDNTVFPNANTSSAITLVGLQSGGNVKVPPNALAKAIQDAIATNVPFNFTGAVTAFNLSGTNSGDQTITSAAGTISPTGGPASINLEVTGLPPNDSATILGLGGASPMRWGGLITDLSGGIAFDPGTGGNPNYFLYADGVGPKWRDRTTGWELRFDVQAFSATHIATWRDLSGTVAFLSDITGGGGLTNVIRAASATVASNTRNRITANSVALTTPASPADFDIIQVLIESGALSSDSVIANSGQTVNGLSTWNLDITPCFVELIYDLATTNWFVTSARFGTT